MNINNTHLKVLKAFKNPANWKPNFTQISKETKVPISTVYELHKRFNCNFLVDLKIEAPKELKKLLGVFEPIK